MGLRSIAVLCAAALAGCGGEVATNPAAFEIEPFRMASLRAPQQVALANGYAGEERYELRTSVDTWRLDLRQVTDTAIDALGRALEKQGIRSGATAAAKSVTLRVRASGGSAMVLVPAVPSVAASARVVLEARFGDGTMTSVDGEDGSAFGVQRAFEGAVKSALHRLLIDGTFLAYMNR